MDNIKRGQEQMLGDLAVCDQFRGDFGDINFAAFDQQQRSPMGQSDVYC